VTKRKNRKRPSPRTTVVTPTPAPESSNIAPANPPSSAPSPVDAGAEVEPRGRPGRRSGDDRTSAVLELLSGKATVEQIGRRLGVQAETVLRWRDAAIAGMAESLKQADGKTKRERELQRELEQLQHAFTRLAIKHEILDRELSKRPTPPGRSSL
jgi:transposase-like protein